MSEITLTIDGREAKGQMGNTVLDVCRANDIYLPTLCYLEQLSVIGACRLCIVEVEGSSRLNSACTTPATDGMVVQTNTDKLRSYRRMILELLFSERNHLCPTCVMNGDCDLQAMAYELGMDHVRYSYLFPRHDMDNTHPYIGMDPNRCILCTRCIRACDEVVGIHTLDLKERGWQTQIEVDLRGELGDSTCISCGACVQVCPTGALFEKFGAYRSKRNERSVVKSVCTACSIGCGLEMSVKDNQVINVDGDFNSEINRGLLCVKGRFDPLQRAPLRQQTPMIDGKKTSWDDALKTVAEHIAMVKQEHGSGSIAGVASPLATNESLYMFKRLLNSVIETPNIDTFFSQDLKVAQEATQRVIGENAHIEADLEDIRMADCAMLVGCTPEESHQVIAAAIRRGVMARRTRLIIINTRTSELDRLADVRLRPIKGTDGILINGLMNAILEAGWATANDPTLVASLEKYTPAFVERRTAIRARELADAAQTYANAQRAVIIYGRGITKLGDPGIVASLINLALLTGNANAGKIRILGLRKGGNVQGAADLGVFSGFDIAKLDPTQTRILYIMAADMELELSEALLDRIREVEFVVFQGSHPGTLAGIANVILPAALWSEQEGSVTSMEHWLQCFDPVVDGSNALSNNGTRFRGDWDVVLALAQQMSANLGFADLDSIRAEIMAQVPSYQFGGKHQVRATSRRDLTAISLKCVNYA